MPFKNALYVFGGVINNTKITNEFLKYDILKNTWDILNPSNDNPDSKPRAVAGHTAHIIRDKMYIFFGYNPYEGFYHRVQIYTFGKI